MTTSGVYYLPESFLDRSKRQVGYRLIKYPVGKLPSFRSIKKSSLTVHTNVR